MASSVCSHLDSALSSEMLRVVEDKTRQLPDREQLFTSDPKEEHILRIELGGKCHDLIPGDIIGRGTRKVVHQALHFVNKKTRMRDIVWSEVLEAEKAKVVGSGLAQLEGVPSHPNISRPFYSQPIYESGQLRGLIALEFNLGVSLEAIGDHYKISPQECMQILAQGAAGMGHLHEWRVIHNDITPGNMIIVPDPSPPEGSLPFRAMWIDFDCVRKLAAGESRESSFFGGGTKAFLAPERLQREPYGFPSDIWSYSVLAYGLVCASFADADVQEMQKTQGLGMIYPPCVYEMELGKLSFLPPDADPPHVPEAVPDEVRAFLDISRDPAERPNASQLEESFALQSQTRNA